MYRTKKGDRGRPPPRRVIVVVRHQDWVDHGRWYHELRFARSRPDECPRHMPSGLLYYNLIYHIIKVTIFGHIGIVMSPSTSSRTVLKFISAPGNLATKSKNENDMKTCRSRWISSVVGKLCCGLQKLKRQVPFPTSILHRSSTRSVLYCENTKYKSPCRWSMFYCVSHSLSQIVLFNAYKIAPMVEFI